MTISEKSAYLKGLMDGMKLSTESDEGKMIAAIVDLLGDMAKRITDIEEIILPSSVSVFRDRPSIRPFRYADFSEIVILITPFGFGKRGR